MSRITLPLLGFILVLLSPLVFAANENSAGRWEKDIQAFEQRDQEQSWQDGGIVFVGSSSIRLWDTAKSFPDDAVINRGFGGSQISDVNHYVDRLVLKYKPSLIVFYAGDNDIAKGKSPQTVLDDFRQFTARVAAELPESQIIYLPIKPSLKRWEMWPDMKHANHLIRKHLATNYRWHYADTPTPMMGDDGKPQPELFANDGLHLNEAGYSLWTSVLKPTIARARAIAEEKVASGTVYHDTNGNRRLDPGDSGIPGVRVSNGQEIVTTDKNGRYHLPVGDDTTVFVLKPAGWRTPVNDLQLPQFYYTHKPLGSPDSRFPGVAATGPLPESIDFPLYPQKEPDQFQAILFGDPQPRDQKEVDYIAHDVVEELIGTRASFGVTLGDIVFDDLEMFEPQARAIALLGIPWYNVLGNHDINYDAANDKLSDETFERHFGPPYYSFDYGTVHFVVTDDIDWVVDTPGKRGRYRGGFGQEQIRFLREDLALIPDDQLVVLLMHIPLTDVHDRQDLYRLIEQRPFCISISGHTHTHEHRIIKRADGWRGPEPHHHIVNVTVSGSWWSGAPDERGIPHTMMRDGAPNGYSIISFDGQKYNLDFRAAGRPAKYQMNIFADEEVESAQAEQASVFVNVFNGWERSVVEMQVSGGEWKKMDQTRAIDPTYRRMFELEAGLGNKPWRNINAPNPSTHLWQTKLPADLAAGTHLIRIRATDVNGKEHYGHRVIRVTKSAASVEPQ